MKCISRSPIYGVKLLIWLAIDEMNVHAIGMTAYTQICYGYSMAYAMKNWQNEDDFIVYIIFSSLEKSNSIS